MEDINKVMLDDMRWGPDMVILNYDNERVWLKQIEGGITDCCFEEEPCEHHAAVAQRQRRGL